MGCNCDKPKDGEIVFLQDELALLENTIERMKLVVGMSVTHLNDIVIRRDAIRHKLRSYGVKYRK